MLFALLLWNLLKIDLFFGKSGKMEEIFFKQQLTKLIHFKCQFFSLDRNVYKIGKGTSFKMVYISVVIHWQWYIFSHQYFEITFFDVQRDFWGVCLSSVNQDRKHREGEMEWGKLPLSLPQISQNKISLRKEHVRNWVYANWYSFNYPCSFIAF